MENLDIPLLTEQARHDGLFQARSLDRQRYPKILHEQGASFNRVINFMMQSSYMQPHLHPGTEKIEKIYIIEGKLATLFFDEKGEIVETTFVEKGACEMIEVPAFTWHTYVILSEFAITYETMMGKYDPKTWKEFSAFSPAENSTTSADYLRQLREKVNQRVVST